MRRCSVITVYFVRMARRKATRRDLPAFCLIYAVIFAAAALGLPFGARADMAQKSELHAISGVVTGISHASSGKAGFKLHILVRAGDGIHKLTQDDFPLEVRELRSLRVGDDITALVRHDSLGRDLDWVWEVRRDGATILSYEQTEEFLYGEYRRFQEIGKWAGMLSLSLLAIGVLLRIRFGVWREPNRINAATAGD